MYTIVLITILACAISLLGLALEAIIADMRHVERMNNMQRFDRAAFLAYYDEATK